MMPMKNLKDYSEADEEDYTLLEFVIYIKLFLSLLKLSNTSEYCFFFFFW